MSDGDDIDTLRERNLEERNAFLSSVMKEAAFAETVKTINQFKQEKDSAKHVSRKPRGNGDSTFKFTGAIPSQRRNSARLQNKKPLYDASDLPTDREARSQDADYDDLEDIVYRVKRTRKSVGRRPSPPRLAVEDVTDAMIKNIHLKGNKIYDGVNATSCHQCRQKTRDQKTVCRSGYCVGVRGQFCGICVVQRYGEDPAQALRDPSWKCYVCRGCCNCSFCRIREGKRPTGILVPTAFNNGFKSVHDLLVSINEHGDVVKPQRDLENLLGFSKNAAVMGGYNKFHFKCDYDSDILDNIKEELTEPDVQHKKKKPKFVFKIKLGKTSREKNVKNLLGFDINEAVMGGNKRVKLDCKYDNAASLDDETAKDGPIVDTLKNEDVLGFSGNYVIVAGHKRISLVG